MPASFGLKRAKSFSADFLQKMKRETEELGIFSKIRAEYFP
ncbi:hypothetical protein [Prosthecobacter sp.]